MKPPKDVLGLGQHLVRELGFEDGVDTLGRWMAHYLAELIGEAENGSTAAKRTSARKEAIETILKIWDHRTSLSGTAYPLTKYRDVLKGIDRLQPGSDLFGYFGLYADNKRDKCHGAPKTGHLWAAQKRPDRKSTRLNSSHRV